MKKSTEERFLARKGVKEILGHDVTLNDNQRRRLLQVLDHPKKIKEIEDWLPAIANFVKYDLTNYSGRLRRLKQMPASPNLYALVLRYENKRQ